MTFCLVSDPWIPVSRPGGQELVSVATALTEASSMLGLAPDIPTQTPAIFRQVLLPVVIDALRIDDPEDWAATFQRGDFSPSQKQTLTEYLERYRDRFDLFHPRHPFAQVGGLRTTNDATRSTGLLIPSEASGNNVPLFRCRTEADVVALTPAQAARWLVHLHCWDPAGIKAGAVGDSEAKSGKSMGNYVGPLGMLGVITPLGQTLFETIMLNLPLYDSSEEDLPHWRTLPATPVWEHRVATGILDLFTWQSRRVRLITEPYPDGPRVTRVVVCGGNRLAKAPEFEPHTAWYWAPPAKKTATAEEKPARWAPRRHVAGRQVWRGLDTLLAMSSEDNSGDDPARFRTSHLLRRLSESPYRDALAPGYPLRIETCGIEYGTQMAVIEDTMSDTLPLPTAALLADQKIRDDVLAVAEQTEQLGRAVDILHANLRRAAGAEPIPSRSPQLASERLFHRLDPGMRRLLASLPHASTEQEREQGLIAWETVAWRAAIEIGGSLLDDAGPATFAGRVIDGRTYRASNASSGFFRQLRTLLPRAAALNTPKSADTETSEKVSA